MSGTVVITGGTGGIGFQTAKGLATKGYEVVVTGRDAERSRAAVERISSESGNSSVHLALGDLSSLAGIEALADDLRDRFRKIDVLINNAGVHAHERVLTVDGFELNFAVNVVAPYRLTKALLPALRASDEARVVNLTGGLPFGGLDVENLQAEKGFRGLLSYNNAKKALEAMSLALAEELRPSGVFLNIVYPGNASTSMTNSMSPKDFPVPMRLMWPVLRRVMHRQDGGASAAKASRSSIFAAIDPTLKGVSGRYFDTNAKPAKHHRTVVNRANQRRVIEKIESVPATRNRETRAS